MTKETRTERFTDFRWVAQHWCCHREGVLLQMARMWPFITRKGTDAAAAIVEEIERAGGKVSDRDSGGYPPMPTR